jgi:hypothetical protein
VLDDAQAPVRQLLQVAHGLSGVDRAPVLALRVPKTEYVAGAPADQPAAPHTTAGIPRGNAVTALREVEARPSTDDARIGCVTHEHCESVEVYHETSMVGLPPIVSRKKAKRPARLAAFPLLKI